MHKQDQNSIFDEPQFKDSHPNPDPSELKTDKLFSRRNESVDEEEQIEHTVWDEPALSKELKDSGDTCHLTYAGWLSRKISTMSISRSWLITLAIALSAGPWAVIGALFISYGGVSFYSAGVIAIIVIGPMTEEFMKIAIPLYVAEKRPFYFKSRLQVLICIIAGGVVFAVIENLIYIYVYIRNPSLPIILWRWTICTLMHVSSTFIAGLGIMRMWADSNKSLSRPQLSLAYPFIISAIILHSLYNILAIILSYTGYFKDF